MKTSNCWELLKCGREPGGAHASLGVCPAATYVAANGLNRGLNGGRICWAIAGTMCGGTVEGDHAQKRLTCTSCEVFRAVRHEEGDAFQVLMAGQTYKPSRRKKDPGAP